MAAEESTQTPGASANGRRYELMVAGLGGQGALLATQILVRAGLGEFPHITWFPSYATFVRGGDCEGTAILSDEPILARPPTRVQQVVKWVKRNPARSLAGAVAAEVDTGAMAMPVSPYRYEAYDY